jgi:hypothetical protein
MSGHIALEIGQNRAGPAGGAVATWPSSASEKSTAEATDLHDNLTSGPWFTEDIHMPHGVSLADVVEAATEDASNSSTESGIIGEQIILRVIHKGNAIIELRDNLRS